MRIILDKWVSELALHYLYESNAEPKLLANIIKECLGRKVLKRVYLFHYETDPTKADIWRDADNKKYSTIGQ